MQRFTRPITREIELGGERLALTLTETGISVRPVGSRKPPLELSWAALLGHLTSGQASEPSAEQTTAAVQVLKGGSRPAPRQAAPAAAAPPPPAAAAPPPRPEAAPAPRADVAALLGRLDKWLAAHRHSFRRGLKPAAGPQEVEDLQHRLGVSVPDDLRRLLTWHNGQDDTSTGCFQGNWFLMGTPEIAQAYQELTGGGKWQRAWIPFLEDNRGNYAFVDTAQPGTPVREFWEHNPEQPTVAPSLAAWLNEFVTAVERGEYAEDPERGVFLRTTS